MNKGKSVLQAAVMLHASHLPKLRVVIIASGWDASCLTFVSSPPIYQASGHTTIFDGRLAYLR